MPNIRVTIPFERSEAPLIAQYSAYCPLCSKYIQKNRSRIARIDPPLVPRGNGEFSADDCGQYNSNGTPISMALAHTDMKTASSGGRTQDAHLLAGA